MQSLKSLCLKYVAAVISKPYLELPKDLRRELQLYLMQEQNIAKYQAFHCPVYYGNFGTNKLYLSLEHLPLDLSQGEIVNQTPYSLVYAKWGRWYFTNPEIPFWHAYLHLRIKYAAYLTHDKVQLIKITAFDYDMPQYHITVQLKLPTETRRSLNALIIYHIV